MAVYTPDRGDVVWINFSPQAGHEQAGRRPAVVLSSRSYNKPSGLALVCPVTNRAKGYPFEVPMPENSPVTGVVLVDQIRNSIGTSARLSLLANWTWRRSLKSSLDSGHSLNWRRHEPPFEPLQIHDRDVRRRFDRGLRGLQQERRNRPNHSWRLAC